MWPERRRLLSLATLAALAPAARATSMCTSGRRQSPIDIDPASARPATGAALRADYRPAPLRIVHDGHTVRVRFPPGSRLWVGGAAHGLQQFHFHLPGGDRIGGEDFPMAMHFLHKSAAGQLVALMLPFRTGAAHAALAGLLPHLPMARAAERSVPGVVVDATQWLPERLAYYGYEGSETAPPCTEGVRWLVLAQPQTASVEQLAQLRRAIAPNARAVQPLNGRVVTLHP